MPSEVEIYAYLEHATDEAYLIFDGIQKVWLPESQVEVNEDIAIEEHGTFVMPEWLAMEKELI